jgi:ERCC4-type nuclease
MAKRFLEHLGCVAEVMNAPAKELMKVEGTGDASATQIGEALDTDFRSGEAALYRITE